MRTHVRTHLRKNKKSRSIVRKHMRKVKRKARELDLDELNQSRRYQRYIERITPKAHEHHVAALNTPAACEFCGDLTTNIIRGHVACDNECAKGAHASDKIIGNIGKRLSR